MTSSLPHRSSLSQRFMELYVLVFYFICFGATAASISYAFRDSRGSYAWFELTDENAPFFFAGALLVAVAVLAAVLRLIGPLAHSQAEIFWKFPGQANLPRNPWKTIHLWAVMGCWALLTVLLATVFAPLSLTWLLSTALGATVSGVLLAQGFWGAQLLDQQRLLHLWSLLTGLVGTVLTLIVTSSSSALSIRGFLMVGSAVLLGLGALISVVLTVSALRKPLPVPSATAAYAHRSILLASLSNIGSPDSYKFYGSTRRFFRSRLARTSPALLSLAAACDSWGPLALALIFSIPLGIFFATSLGTVGIGLVLIGGCWMVASLYRWLAREWTAQLSLRAWLGGSYLRQLLGFALGPAVMVALYALGISLIFSLPLYLPVIALVFGTVIALGDSDPPQQFNYELTIPTPEGIMIPLEPVKALLSAVMLIAIQTFAIFLGPAVGLGTAFALLALVLFNHWLKNR